MLSLEHYRMDGVQKARGHWACKSCGTCSWVFVQISAEVSKPRSVSTFRVKVFLDFWTLKMTALLYFETSVNIYTNTQGHIPDDFELQQYRYNKLEALK
jgi:hypothetical protein